jgi:hypothetical protein
MLQGARLLWSMCGVDQDGVLSPTEQSAPPGRPGALCEGGRRETLAGYRSPFFKMSRDAGVNVKCGTFQGKRGFASTWRGSWSMVSSLYVLPRGAGEPCWPGG